MYKTGNANVDLRSPGETMIEPAGELRLPHPDAAFEGISEARTVPQAAPAAAVPLTPLLVELNGTLVETDLLIELIVRLLRQGEVARRVER